MNGLKIDGSSHRVGAEGVGVTEDAGSVGSVVGGVVGWLSVGSVGFGVAVGVGVGVVVWVGVGV